MSLCEPLLKSMKYLIQEFHSVGENITDKSPYLEQYCETIEQCFLKGLKQGHMSQDKARATRRHRFWQMIISFETHGPTPYGVSYAVATALADRRIRTSSGRLRYVIRHCLMHSSLHVLVEFLMSQQSTVKLWYYCTGNNDRQSELMVQQFGGGNSIIIHDELAEQLRSLLLTCSTSLNFDLSLTNTYFLDETWQLPQTSRAEFVPTNELGIEIVYIKGYGIVSRIKPGSVAADNLDLRVGDLLVEMNGKVLFPATVGGESDANSVWKHCKRKSLPCELTVIKPRSRIGGGIYPPLRAVLKEFHSAMEDYHKERRKILEEENDRKESESANRVIPKKTNEQTPVLDPEAAEGGLGGTFRIRYIGEVSTGELGGVNQIERVIRQVLNKRREVTSFDVSLTLTQIAVETETNGAPLFNHKYADISSCGKLITDEKHFCYIAGDTFCTISKRFKGYVFEANSKAQARSILNAIYQGFKRTTWFM